MGMPIFNQLNNSVKTKQKFPGFFTIFLRVANNFANVSTALYFGGD